MRLLCMFVSSFLLGSNRIVTSIQQDNSISSDMRISLFADRYINIYMECFSSYNQVMIRVASI